MYENINWKHNNQCPDVNFETSLHIKTWRTVGENKMNRFPETALQLCIILTEKLMVNVPPEIEAFVNKFKSVSGFLVAVTVVLLTLTLFIRDVLQVTTPASGVCDAVLTIPADRNIL